AEGHAVTFAGGLAAGGLVPVFSVYSTFLQRSYDQIIHDAAMQNLHIVLAVDRAGIVGEDGETHQGVFDVSFLNSIPNTTIFCPTYFDELRDNLNTAINKCNSVVAVRFPRGGEDYKPNDFKPSLQAFDVYGNKDAKKLIITYGRLFSQACLAKEKLAERGIDVCILKLNQIKPIPPMAIEIAEKFENIFFFEEGMQNGGIGEKMSVELSKRKYNGQFVLNAIDDRFIPHAPVDVTLKRLGLDCSGIVNMIVRNDF
ncbi:MAG: transketolase C-terminal domain-containing protein, partial [Bacillota bacterium]|nr:transketolase C-terminal domain-containing protein [Bacillota bacterium]